MDGASSTTGRRSMLDILYLALALGAFALFGALAAGLRRL